MTVLNSPKSSPEMLALNGQAAFKPGETIGLHESDLQSRDTADLSRLALGLAHSAKEFNKPQPNVFEAGRIEQQFTVAPSQNFRNSAPSYAEKAVNPPYNPAEFPSVVGVNLSLMRKDAMGEVLVDESAKPKVVSFGDKDSYGLPA